MNDELDPAAMECVPIDDWIKERAERLSEDLHCHIEVLAHPPIPLVECDSLHRMIMISIRDWFDKAIRFEKERVKELENRRYELLDSANRWAATAKDYREQLAKSEADLKVAQRAIEEAKNDLNEDRPGSAYALLVGVSIKIKKEDNYGKAKS